jgi:hypothetical protein
MWKHIIDRESLAIPVLDEFIFRYEVLHLSLELRQHITVTGFISKKEAALASCWVYA